MASLHTVNKSPTSSPLLMRCVRFAAPQSAVLLIEDGVYGATAAVAGQAPMEPWLSRFTWYVLRPDLQARGLSPALLHPAMRPIDDLGFVELALASTRIINWY